MTIQVPVPPMSNQRAFDALCQQVAQLRATRAPLAAGLNGSCLRCSTAFSKRERRSRSPIAHIQPGGAARPSSDRRRAGRPFATQGEPVARHEKTKRGKFATPTDTRDMRERSLMGNTSGLWRGGPGRPAGVPNKASREVRGFCRRLIGATADRESPEDGCARAPCRPRSRARLALRLRKPPQSLDVTSRGPSLASPIAARRATTTMRRTREH